mmetsp:Transcript_34079/g.47236  ORF Transcript_34079/g.47236 Transcript_34079/m.47236 type:complete len:412 (-) Transcript_34079:120-1355(-)|eukprot:CAMPEP_0196588460 /NCGR_PEP_ID=MMETSP1081-20130531/60591_1 /TAXON_ID=36882 /ORGANISM="Pyramimonas amylifera, Strain CCMP720" /LENGTH=411 /DNA_ID=CAMNT_0041910959 /DNA_START=254 /DNA_END=1489 /DNA_ORIENTATION=+
MGIVLRRVFRYTWIGVCLITLVTLPGCAVVLHRHHYSLQYLAWFIAGVFVLLTLPISLYDVTQHYEHFTKPKLQRHVARVLWMVPIYSVDSWLALRFPAAGIYLNTLRECYEAYVIYNFYMYLIAYLEEAGEGSDTGALGDKEPFPHIWPVSCALNPWPPGREFIRKCKNGMLNYVVLRPITTLVAFITEMIGVYGHNQLFNWRRAYLYCALTNNFSQTWALYCLALLYLAYQRELAPMNPFYKFLCVKATVFFSFWQALAIMIMLRIGLFAGMSGPFEETAVAEGLQNFAICIEMFFASLLHSKAFSARQFRDATFPSRSVSEHLRDMFDIEDVVDEVQQRAVHLRNQFSKSVSLSRLADLTQQAMSGRVADLKSLKEPEINSNDAKTSIAISEEEILLVSLPMQPSYPL